jgi:predicted Fe-S protein YdhL (DUF1289 family)
MTNSGTPPQRAGGIAKGEVASPCISVCVLHEAKGLCIGCFRTLDEIAQWSVLDTAGKRAVLAALPARRAAFGEADNPDRTHFDADR